MSETNTAQSSQSVVVIDPLVGTHVIHGATGKRPKAYAGEFISCPWDKPHNVLAQSGAAFLTVNDFPALRSDNEPKVPDLQDLYQIHPLNGECLMVIYSHKHDAHWLTLTPKEQQDVVHLWTITTKRSMANKSFVFTELFENDGPTNSMSHPHGQQYNFSEIPPYVVSELTRCDVFYKKKGKNLLRTLYDQETKDNKRIFCENDSFIAFAPPGAKWPYQVRVLPRRHVNWLSELSEKEQNDFADVITNVRQSYKNLFMAGYKPTIMMTIQQVPFGDKKAAYTQTYGLRVEFYNTALSPKAEKLMFSIENSTGYILYSDSAEQIAEQLRGALRENSKA